MSPSLALEENSDQYFKARHQASFLPLIEVNALVKPLYQRSLHRTLVIHEELEKNPIAEAIGSSVPVSV